MDRFLLFLKVAPFFAGESFSHLFVIRSFCFVNRIVLLFFIKNLKIHFKKVLSMAMNFFRDLIQEITLYVGQD